MKLIPDVKTFGMTVAFCLIFGITAFAQAAQAVTLDSLRMTYTNEVVKIDAKIQNKLDMLLKVLTQRGDLDGYKVVTKEANRFREDRTIVADASQTNSANEVFVYQSLLSINTQLKSQEIDLLTRYIEALKEPLKNLMLKKKMVEAETVNNEIKAQEIVLAELQLGNPKPEKPAVADMAPVVAVKDGQKQVRVDSKAAPVKSKNLVGTWFRKGNKLTGAPDKSFQFKSDGSFSARGFPDKGTWEIHDTTVTLTWLEGRTKLNVRTYKLITDTEFSGKNGREDETYKMVVSDGSKE